MFCNSVKGINIELIEESDDPKDTINILVNCPCHLLFDGLMTHACPGHASLTCRTMTESSSMDTKHEVCLTENL